MCTQSVSFLFLFLWIGTLKICDFSMSGRGIEWTEDETGGGGMQSFYYSAPEVLEEGSDVNNTSFSSEADVWSVGCIFAELFLKRPLFCGESYAQQVMLWQGVQGPFLMCMYVCARMMLAPPPALHIFPSLSSYMHAHS